MNRIIVGALLGALAVPLASPVHVAHAAPKKAKQAGAKAAPQSAEIDKSMGELKWGQPREEVYAHFENQIKEKYKPLISKARNAMDEDKQRAAQKDELAKLKNSVVEFSGKKTGWDVSFLKGEFTHHNGESMFVVSDGNSENYYFFIQNKLWKWYKAFKAEAFEGKSFEQFGQAIESRYGKGAKREGEAVHGGGKQSWLEWQDSDTRLRAVDESQFYGFYCLVFEDKATLNKLGQLRTAKAKETKSGNSLVDSVTSDEAHNSASDNNPDAIDRITGKIRNRQDAPGNSGAAHGANAGKKGDAPAAPPSPPPSSGGVSKEDDPLKGLGL
jgi:flagellin-like hook-associated protein FlgL